MRTPGQDRELTVGFLLTEGVIRSIDDVQSVAHCRSPSDKGLHNSILVELSPGVELLPGLLERHTVVSSSCGICGKTSIDAVQSGGISQTQHQLKISGERLMLLPHQLRSQQPGFERTGGVHAAALFDAEGQLFGLCEDVGRHNALDKVLGKQCLEHGLPLKAVGVMLSGRVSFELIQKAAVAGAEIVVAIGAPSSLAIELASALQITLVGFVRETRLVVYCDAGRVL